MSKPDAERGPAKSDSKPDHKAEREHERDERKEREAEREEREELAEEREREAVLEAQQEHAREAGPEPEHGLSNATAEYEHPPAHKRKLKALPDSDVATLTRILLAGWASGIPGVWTDSTGARWEYETIRDTQTRLQAQRFVHDERNEDDPEATWDEPFYGKPSGGFAIMQNEFGVDDPAPLIGSRILAVSST
jgi:hypothetical protein